MLNRNLIWIGLLIGLILPALLYVILLNLFSLLEIKGAASSTGLSQNFRERTLAIVALMGAGHAGCSGGYHRTGAGLVVYLWGKTFLRIPAVK